MKSSCFPLLCSAAVLALGLSHANAEIKESAVEYKAGDVLCEGWQAYDSAKDGRRPAVLIIHQWTGLTENEKMRARMRAELGYNVLAADIYGKGIRPQPPAAGAEAGNTKATVRCIAPASTPRSKS